MEDRYNSSAQLLKEPLSFAYVEKKKLYVHIICINPWKPFYFLVTSSKMEPTLR